MAQNTVIIGAVAGIAALVGIGAYVMNSDGANGEVAPQLASDSTAPIAQPNDDIADEAAAPASSASYTKVPATLQDGIATLGHPDAPVTVIEYASMTCPHCADFHMRHFPAIKQAYIDTGKVKFEFRPFPLDGLALRVSAVATCGGADRYFAYLKAFFGSQRDWATSSQPLDEMAKIARLGGMSREDFDACVADQALLNQIVGIRTSGAKQHKINATPSFVIDGETVSGDMTPAAFAKLVDPLLPADKTQNGIEGN